MTQENRRPRKNKNKSIWTNSQCSNNKIEHSATKAKYISNEKQETKIRTYQ